MKITEGVWAGFEVYLKAKRGSVLRGSSETSELIAAEHRVTHHPAQGKEPATTKVFVEYHDGQEFSICVSHSSPLPYVVDASFTVDGRDFQGLLHDGKYPGTSKKNKSYEKVHGCLWSKKLRFEPIKRVDEGFTVDKALEDQLGTIVVLLEQVDFGKLCFRFPEAAPPPKSIMNSASKPGRLSSYVGGRMKFWTLPRFMCQVHSIAGTVSHKVIFYYYTADMLMEMGVIPYPSSPAKEKDDNLAEVSDTSSDTASSFHSIDEEKREITTKNKKANSKRKSVFWRLSCTDQSRSFNIDDNAGR